MSQSTLTVQYSTGVVNAERKSGTSFCDGFAVVADCVSSITHSTVVVFPVDVKNYYSILQVSNFVQPAVIAVPLIIFASSSCGWQFYSIFVELLLAKTAFVIIVTLTVVVLSEN